MKQPPFDSKKHFQNYAVLDELISRVDETISTKEILVLAQFFTDICNPSDSIDFAWGDCEEFFVPCDFKNDKFVSQLAKLTIRLGQIKFGDAFLDDDGSLVFVVTENFNLWNIFGAEHNAALAGRKK